MVAGAGLPGKGAASVGPDELKAGKFVAAVKPAAPSQEVAIAILGDWKEMRLGVAEQVRNRHRNRIAPAGFQVAINVPQDGVSELRFEGKNDQLGVIEIQVEASGVGETRPLIVR